MTTIDSILVILGRSQATTEVIAGELHQGTPVVAGYCEDAADAGFIESQPIGGSIPCWHLTDLGREQLNQMLAAKQAKPIAHQ